MATHFSLLSSLYVSDTHKPRFFFFFLFSPLYLSSFKGEPEITALLGDGGGAVRTKEEAQCPQGRKLGYISVPSPKLLSF